MYLGCDFFERVHMRIGTVRMFFPFFVSDGHLCFSLIFFVILLAAQGSLCASTHVHQPSDGVPAVVKNPGAFLSITNHN